MIEHDQRHRHGFTLLDIVTLPHLVERLARLLPFGSLLSMSRVNTSYRAALHGFPPVYGMPNYSLEEDSQSISETQTLCPADSESTCFTDSDTISTLNSTTEDNEYEIVRPTLRIGWHQTELWKRLKSISQLECSEPFHKRGKAVKNCRICSMPVCEACVVRSSFSRNGNTFDNRNRHLCETCFESGNPHKDRLRYGPYGPPLNYHKMSRCECTPKDGSLCLECREEHLLRWEDKMWKCAGHNCKGTVSKAWAVRVCLWCNGVVPGHRNREDYWLGFDARFAEGLERDNKRMDHAPMPWPSLFGDYPQNIPIPERVLPEGHRTSLGRVLRNGRYDYWHLPARTIPSGKLGIDAMKKPEPSSVDQDGVDHALDSF